MDQNRKMFDRVDTATPAISDASRFRLHDSESDDFYGLHAAFGLRRSGRDRLT